MVQGIVETTISYVAQAFRASDRPDPRLDLDGKTCFLLQEQWRGYKNTDKNRKKQKALPASVLRKMYEFSSTDWEFALTHLFVLALFFAMRSCEYMETRYPEESKRTKILRCKNFTFKKDGCRLNHSLPFETLASADLVIILFEFQKNDWINHSVHMFCNGDAFLCPVRAAAFTVKRVMKIPGATADSKICSFSSSDGKISCINSAQALPRLRAVVGLIGPESLGFLKDEIGLHSLRSGGAMAMFLAGVATIIIMRIGRWSSEAFLEYIREQVEQFTLGVSKKMLQFENFNTIDSNSESVQNSIDMKSIFIEADKSNGAPIPISHKIQHNLEL